MVIRLRSQSANMTSSCKVSPDQVRDDFLRSTMRIFLVVSPPAGRIQGRSRSLTHIDALDPAMLVKSEDMDSKSEPDTSQEQLIVPTSDTHHRRHKLSRSQVSSSEFVSVSFECLDDPGPEEFLPATRGTSLAEALRSACERRGVELGTVNVYLESSKTPLPILTTETFWLGGKHLRIRAKEDKSPVRSTRSAGTPQRKTSGSYRSKGSRFFSASTEDPSHAGDSPGSTSLPGLGLGDGGSLKVGKSGKQSNRWSGLFSNSYKDTKMDAMVEQLNTYSKNGIPKLKHLLTFETDDENEEDLYSLEDDWRQLVHNWASLSERLIQQQTAIWELLDTEAAYIRTLKVIQDLFLMCLCNLQTAGILSEVDTVRLFANISDIYGANRFFWQNHLVPTMHKSRVSGEPLSPLLMAEGFIKFSETFHPYAKYCADQSQCQQYCKEKHHENEFFKAYLAWCETQKDCNRLRLMDILVKPMQRLTKYSLLLKAIQKHTEEPEARKRLEEMIQSVGSFVASVNATLRQRQEQERLRGIIARIEAYDVVETKDDEVEKMLRQHCNFDLTCPMPGCIESQRRHLLVESDLKLKDHTTSKVDVHCFLFTDMLLMCKTVAKKGEKVKVIRQPYVVDRLVVHEIKDSGGLALLYLNEYGTATTAFTLHSSEPKLVKSWMDHIRKAQSLYREAKVAAMSDVPLGPGPGSPSPFDLEEEEDLDLPTSALLVARSHRGSSRGSHVSSLVHSHSGSMDMNEASSGSLSQGRGVSLENDLRGSSVSSDEGSTTDGHASNAVATSGSGAVAASLPTPSAAGSAVASVKPRALSMEGSRLVQPTSPRPERRSFLSKSPTPNTLSVQLPYSSGQSMPNLSVEGGHSTLTVPSPKALSPSHRGISYPPPSPRSLRRSCALSSQRNPPLIKTRHVGSTTSPTGTDIDPHFSAGANTTELTPAAARHHPASVDFDVPIIRGVSPPSDDISPVSPTPERCRGEIHSEAYTNKRLARTERQDPRRYHTAGAIEDIKKQDTRENSIQKRFSWNYGQMTAPPQAQSRLVGSGFSCESVRSSSGVSSTGSLYLSLCGETEEEALLEGPEDDSHAAAFAPRVSPACESAMSRVSCVAGTASDFPSLAPPRPTPTPTSTPSSHSTSPTPHHHVSTTYITQETDVSFVDPLQAVANLLPTTPQVNVLQSMSVSPKSDVRIDVSEVQDGISSVQISVADGTVRSSKVDLLRMKDFILSDANMESSDV